MREAGMKTRTDLANAAHKDLSTVSRALNGKQNVTLRTMNELAKALDAVVHIHVERRAVRGGWVPLDRIRDPDEVELAGRPRGTAMPNHVRFEHEPPPKDEGIPVELRA